MSTENDPTTVDVFLKSFGLNECFSIGDMCLLVRMFSQVDFHFGVPQLALMNGFGPMTCLSSLLMHQLFLNHASM
jgi:hypothetical protein